MIPDPKGSGRQHPLARSAEVLLFWLPVLVPLLLLGQLGTQGLRPALVNAEKLGEDERKLDERLSLTELERGDLEAELNALTDPIYHHRNELLLREKAGADRPAPDTVPARNR